MKNNEQLQKQKRKFLFKKYSKTTLIHICMISLGIILLFPFIWTLSTSLKTETELLSGVFTLFPEGRIWDWDWENYSTAIELMNYPRAFLNTVIVVVGKLFGDIFISALVAFGFAKFFFPGKRIIFLILLGSLMIPFEVTMIPLYVIYSQIGWIDTFKPLIVPALFGASQFIFFLSMYFQTIPDDLIKAARVDGKSYLSIFRRIILPLSVPALIVVGIWSFQGTWNDLLGPLIWLQSAEMFTLQLSLASLSTSTTYYIEQGVIMAATILVIVPVLIVFLVLQKYILDGVSSDGIKG